MDVSLGGAVGALGGAVLGAAIALAVLLRTRWPVAAPSPSPGFDKLAETLSEVARSAHAQAESMSRLAVMTAESVRLASGSYVYELRDRFDAALGPSVVGVAHVELSGGSDLGPVEALAFQAGDRVRAEVRITVNQSFVRRIVTAQWDPTPGRCQAHPATFAAAAGVPIAGNRWELPTDVSLFIDMALDLDVGSLAPGPFETKGQLALELTDSRPEGVISRFVIDVRIAATVVPDDDGIGLDGPVIDAVLGDEHRSYLLEKSSNLVLELPRLRELN